MNVNTLVASAVFQALGEIEEDRRKGKGDHKDFYSQLVELRESLLRSPLPRRPEVWEACVMKKLVDLGYIPDDGESEDDPDDVVMALVTPVLQCTPVDEK
jgi:hypothetical protein